MATLEGSKKRLNAEKCQLNFSSFSVSRRLKSVKNIQKITKYMKMVSAAKFAKAERELRAARSYGLSAKGSQKVPIEKMPNRFSLSFLWQFGSWKSRRRVIAIGDESRAGLGRTHSANLFLSINEVGKRSLVFGDASAIAQQLINSGFEYDSADIVYNKFK